jgi:phosphatidylinositol alpha-1,6-mannosyltransferase
LIERKGHDRVLSALPRIVEHFRDTLYCIVGIGPYEGKLREQVKRLNLEESVRFMGRVSEEELVFLYNACQVFVMPSREISEGGHVEGFGIVYLEANACGKPVIGGRSGGVLEAIREGQTGWLVDPDSASDLADKIIDLLSHPEKAQALGEQGLQWVRKTFNWEDYAEQVFELVS